MKFLFPMNIQFFAGEGAGTGEGGGEGNTPKTYTEEELKAKIKEERKAAAAEAVKKRFGDLADMDLEELKAAVELKRKSDENKKKTDGEGEGAPNVDAIIEEKLKAERQATFKRLVTAEVKLQANELGFADWEDALALANLSEVKEDEKGNITGVKEALEELVKKKPHLLKQQKPKGGFGADIPNNKQQQGKSKEELIKLAQNRGVVADRKSVV